MLTGVMREISPAFYLEANSGIYCNEMMHVKGPETMVKYSLGGKEQIYQKLKILQIPLSILLFLSKVMSNTEMM